MLELQSVSLLDLGMKTFESSLFLEHQSSQRLAATKLFETVFERIQTIVQHVCTHVANLAAVVDSTANPSDAAAKLFHADEKLKSMVAIKADEVRKRRATSTSYQFCSHPLPSHELPFLFTPPSPRTSCHLFTSPSLLLFPHTVSPHPGRAQAHPEAR